MHIYVRRPAYCAPSRLSFLHLVQCVQSQSDGGLVLFTVVIVDALKTVKYASAPSQQNY